MTVAPITPLLFRGRPAAIAGFIVPVLVRVTVQRCFVRSQPHIGKEVRECRPAFTDRDPATSVEVISGILGIAASLMHGAPTHVRRAACQAMTQMSRLSARLVFLASAADRQATLKIGCIDWDFRPAGTAAQPSRFESWIIRFSSNNREPSKGFAHQII